MFFNDHQHGLSPGDSQHADFYFNLRFHSVILQWNEIRISQFATGIELRVMIMIGAQNENKRLRLENAKRVKKNKPPGRDEPREKFQGPIFF